MSTHVVILAAGQGTRMKSALPKVLHPIANKPMLAHVIETAQTLGGTIHVVIGHGSEQVRASLSDYPVQWVNQAQQLGTGHAVQQALAQIADGGNAVILYGDVPLIQASTIQAMLSAIDTQSGVALLTAHLHDPNGYGRIIRNAQAKVTEIVEQKDATRAQRQVREINTGILAAKVASLRHWLAKVGNENAQGEYYLTDIIALAVQDQQPIHTFQPNHEAEIMGVNDRVQLSQLERYYQRRQCETMMRNGVSVFDPRRLDIRGSLTYGTDVTIDINVIFEGRVELGDGITIGPNCVIKNCKIEDNVEILGHCILEDARIGAGSRIGPFARIRPETVVAKQVHIGNFVEVKKSTIGPGSKVNHLSYIGDTQMGADVNIGAGTITCNYDGAHKHTTHIGDRVFIGSDTQLVAPVTVEDGATIGAGSTITKNAPAEELSLSRARQITIKGWKRPVKNKNP